MSGGLRTWAGIARSIAIYRMRPWKQARLVQFYRGLVRPGDLAFDIGAHVGNRTRALRACGAHVVALEPQAAFHRLLKRNLPDGVTLLPLAAGARAGHARLAVSRLHPTVSSLEPGFATRMAETADFRGVAWDAEEWVEVTTLDTLIARYGAPRFVKIDVEGHEADVLAGLSQTVPCIAFEVLSADLGRARECLARLDALGPYAYNFVPGEAHAYALPAWTDAAGVLAAVEARSGEVRSGDIYARLVDPS